MAQPFTLKLGAIDLSNYIRLNADDGFDPYDGDGFDEPAFSDAPFAEGHPLTNIDSGNREMSWPLYLKGTAVAGTGTAYRDAVVADSPLAFYRMAEAAGTTATDNQGSFNGTYVNSPTLGASSPLSEGADKAVTFTAASSQRVDAASPTAATNNWSMECWVKLANLSNQDALFVVNGGDRLVGCGYAIGIGDGAGGVGGGLKLTGLVPGVAWTPTNYTFADTNWHYIVMVRDAGTIKIYVDGAAVTVTGGAASVPAAPSTSLTIAADHNNSDTLFNRYFNGSIDEVAVYNTVLSPARVAAHYAAASSGGTAALTAKDSLHLLINQINREIQAPTTSPLRVEWKDQGAVNSTFYDVTYARFDPNFNYRRSGGNWVGGILRIFCAPPYGHTGTERIVASVFSSTQPNLIASLIGVGSPVQGDVPAQARVTVTMSGSQQPGPAGRVVGVSPLTASGFIPFISAASFAQRHASAAVYGASGAPGSQAIYRHPWQDPSWVARIGLGATMYLGRQRILLAVNPAISGAGAAFHVTDDSNAMIGPTALAYRPEGWQLIDVGVVTVGTANPTTTLSIYGGVAARTLADLTELMRPLPGVTVATTAVLGIGGVFVMPEDTSVFAIDRSVRPLVKSYFGATGAATAAWPSAFIGDYGETWQAAAIDQGIFNASGAYLTASGAGGGGGIAGVVNNVSPISDFRMRTIIRPLGSAVAGIFNMGLIDKAGGGNFAIGPIFAAASGLGNVPIIAYKSNSSGATNIASVVIASIAGFPVGPRPLLIELVRQRDRAYVTVSNPNGSGIGYIPSAGMVATLGPYASAGYVAAANDPYFYGQGVPYFNMIVSTHWLMSYFQMDELRNVPQASDVYRITSVSNDSSLRSPIAGSGPNTPLGPAMRGPQILLTPSHTGVFVVDAMIDGGPMNDINSVEVRVRERYRYAR